jgi:hypothetical protein
MSAHPLNRPGERLRDPEYFEVLLELGFNLVSLDWIVVVLNNPEVLQVRLGFGLVIFLRGEVLLRGRLCRVVVDRGPQK